MAKTGRPPQDPIQRFWGHVNKDNPNGCWTFESSITKTGYAQFKLPGKVRKYAHRYSWEIHYGPITDGMNVCHRCDNRICIRPDHLFLGTDVDNEQDKWRKGRGKPMKGEKNWNAKLTEEHVRHIRELYAAGKYSGMQLASMYSISFQTAYSIINGKIWKHVT